MEVTIYIDEGFSSSENKAVINIYGPDNRAPNI